jgi:spore coat protein U-like protein
MRILKNVALCATGLALLCSPLALPAHAIQIGTGAMTIGVSVGNSCSVTAGALAFGTYDASNGTNAYSDITVLCTVGTAYNVGLNAGTASGATVATRKLSSGASRLNYTLYSNTGRTVVWGNTIGSDTVGATYTLNQQPHRVYGRIPPGQTVIAGTYNDTITVTITY